MDDVKDDVKWTTSRFSSNGASCVMVARVGNEIWVGDSKNPDAEPMKYSLVEWIAFKAGMAAGDFDKLI